MKIPSTRKLTPKEIDDVADLIDDAAAGIELKDVGPNDMQTAAARDYAAKLLHKIAVIVQNSK